MLSIMQLNKHTNRQTRLAGLCLLGAMLALPPLAAEARRDADNERQYNRGNSNQRGAASHRQFLPGEHRQGKPRVDKTPRPSQQSRGESRGESPSVPRSVPRNEPRNTRTVERDSPPRRHVLTEDSRQRQQRSEKAPRPAKQEHQNRRDNRDEDRDRDGDKQRSQRFLPGEHRQGKSVPEKYRTEQRQSDKQRNERDKREPRGERDNSAPRTERDRAKDKSRNDHRRDNDNRNSSNHQRSPNRDGDHRRDNRRVSHDRHYREYVTRRQHNRHYHRHETYRYHTRYLAPIRHHYHPIGFRLSVLPRSYVRIVVLGAPFFYLGGVFYHHHNNAYVVVRAPIGAVVTELPIGFIAFSIGAFTYYHVNDTYYIWDDTRDGYVVVDKPRGAETALAEATKGRLVVYPNQGQSEELQASDRYACHRWAVTESRVDPTLEESDDLTREEKIITDVRYRLALKVVVIL